MSISAMTVEPSSYFNGEFEWPAETAMAFETRLRFIARALQQADAKNVLDVGCGNGRLLTAMLARLCPGCRFHGIDPDETSITSAQEIHEEISNLSFSIDVPAERKYDVVIASEVIEHVDEPYEFLAYLRSKVNDNGLVIVTTPNGYGCSEWMSLLDCLMTMSGIWGGIRAVKRAIVGPGSTNTEYAADTCAVSPHVNFFGWRRLNRMFRKMNLSPTDYQGRMFLHNFVISMIIDRLPLVDRVNSAMGRSLPAPTVSDWMFVLRAADECAPPKYQRNLYEQWKRSLNLKRWGLA